MLLFIVVSSTDIEDLMQYGVMSLPI